jgi:hypothetical protein
VKLCGVATQQDPFTTPADIVQLHHFVRRCTNNLCRIIWNGTSTQHGTLRSWRSIQRLRSLSSKCAGQYVLQAGLARVGIGCDHFSKYCTPVFVMIWSA